MKSSIFFVVLTFSLILLHSCQQDEKTTEESLKSVYKDNFHMGVALNTRQITGEDSIGRALIKEQFNSITAENIMKWMYLHPEPDRFDFNLADDFVEFGLENNMYILGHTLVWHSQLADWVHEMKDSASLAHYMLNHIDTILSRYKGKVNGWDVVNEALNEDGTLRNSVFYNIIGDKYISMAFQKAHSTDPEADLYYNDYNLCQEEKRNGAIRLIKSLQDKDVNIDGVGIQAHWSLVYPSIEEIETSILEYAKLGIEVMFTELDVTVLPNPWDLEGADVDQKFQNNEKMNPYPESLPDSVDVKLAQRYEEIFELFLKHEDKISRVTFWGVNDRYSWLNNWPIRGRTNYPLLFDRDYEPKQAYYRVVGVKEDSQVEAEESN